MQKGIVEGPVAGYEAEANGFAELGMSSESKALRSLFFGQVWLVIYVFAQIHNYTTHTHTYTLPLSSVAWHCKHLICCHCVSPAD